MNPATMTPKKKNAHYGMINDRFDARVAELIQMGFKQESIKEHNMVIFTRKDPGYFWTRNQTVCAATVLYADALVWADHLKGFRGE